MLLFFAIEKKKKIYTKFDCHQSETMKSIIFTVFLLISATTIIVACNKPVYKYNADFEGTWRSLVVYDTILNANVVSEILIDGADGWYKNTCSPCGADLCNCISTQVGKAVMNTSKTQMKIGSSNSLVLTIQEEPNIDANGIWTMKIQGLRYYKQ